MFEGARRIPALPNCILANLAVLARVRFGGIEFAALLRAVFLSAKFAGVRFPGYILVTNGTLEAHYDTRLHGWVKQMKLKPRFNLKLNLAFLSE